jgi:hypothetical protein
MNWPRISDEELAKFSPRIRALIETEQEDMIRKSDYQLQDLKDRSKDYIDFSVMYRRWRRDGRETIKKVENIINKELFEFSNNNTISNEDKEQIEETIRMNQLLIVMYRKWIDYKLEEMVRYCKFKWGRNIVEIAGKEGGFADRSGCLLMIVFFVFALCITWIYFK